MAIFQHTPGVLNDRLGEETVLIDSNGTELITLNRVGGLVWEAIDGERTEAGIADELIRRFPHVDAAEITRDVERFLAELRRVDLIGEVGAT